MGALMNADEFLKKYGLDESAERNDHSLRGHAWERAQHPGKPKAGSPHDWEDWYKAQQDSASQDQDDDK